MIFSDILLLEMRSGVRARSPYLGFSVSPTERILRCGVPILVTETHRLFIVRLVVLEAAGVQRMSRYPPVATCAVEKKKLKPS